METITNELIQQHNCSTNMNMDHTSEEFNEDNIKYKFIDLLHEITQKRILLKLNRNSTLIVPGKIIHFSELIKKLCCASNFDYKLTLETVDRNILEIILEFFEILDWRLENFFFELKSHQLKNWYMSYKTYTKQIESTAKFLGINHILKYLRDLNQKENVNKGTLIVI